MSCAYSCVKYLLFFFNFLFALGGLAILIVGVLIQVGVAGDKHIQEVLPEISDVSLPSAVLIAVGAVIFVIAFFGCCGAIRESHCMIVTFAMLLLTLLIIQVAVATYAFIKLKDKNFEDSLDNAIKKGVDSYFETDEKSVIAKNGLESIQSLFSCCGYNSYRDFLTSKNPRQMIPRSCCKKPAVGEECATGDVLGVPGCQGEAYQKIKTSGTILGGLALGIAGIELIGIIFSFCLANSIRNVERRGYKV